MDQATGLISVSESEEERDEELATANVVESRKKDVKKAKAAANQSTTAAMFGQIGISSDDEADDDDLGGDSEEEDDAEDLDEDPNFLVSDENTKLASPKQQNDPIRNNFFEKMQKAEESKSGSKEKGKSSSNQVNNQYKREKNAKQQPLIDEASLDEEGEGDCVDFMMEQLGEVDQNDGEEQQESELLRIDTKKSKAMTNITQQEKPMLKENLKRDKGCLRDSDDEEDHEGSEGIDEGFL